MLFFWQDSQPKKRVMWNSTHKGLLQNIFKEEICKKSITQAVVLKKMKQHMSIFNDMAAFTGHNIKEILLVKK